MASERPLKRTERLQIMLDEAELHAIDEWRFDHRMPSRAAAVREMIRLAISSKDSEKADLGERSADFGALPDGDGGALSKG